MRDEIRKILSEVTVDGMWGEDDVKRIMQLVDKHEEDMICGERIENAELFKQNYDLRKELIKLKNKITFENIYHIIKPKSLEFELVHMEAVAQKVVDYLKGE